MLIYIAHSSLPIVAQDIHFSNWNMSPLNINPANTGGFNGDGRLIFNYRRQWQSVPIPYSTFSFGSDFNLKKSFAQKTNQAVGVLFNHDAAGDGRYKINEFKVPLSHKINFKFDSTFTATIGLMAGFTNINIDANKLSYDRQWDGDIYNSGLANGEAFNNQSKTFADAGIGTVISKQFKNKIKVTVGYNLNHINKPNISFYNNAKVTLKPKHNEFLQLHYNVSNKAFLMLEYYAAQQQKFRENLVGASYYYTINTKTKTIINAGLLTRIGDAFITTLGLEYESTRVQLSYDYNYSQFKKATNTRGGFELSLIYIYAKPKIFVPKTRVCPIYM